MMAGMTTVGMVGLYLKLNFMAGVKWLYIMMQKNAKTGIVLPFNAK